MNTEPAKKADKNMPSTKGKQADKKAAIKQPIACNSHREHKLTEWCHGEMTCTCGDTVAHQDVINDVQNFGELVTALEAIAALPTCGGLSAGQRKGLEQAAVIANAALDGMTA